MRTVAVVLAGGAGLRLGGDIPKQLRPLAGRPMLEYSVSAFDQAPGVDDILVVMAAEFTGQVREALGIKFGKLRGVIAGGTDRPGSTQRAIEALTSADWLVSRSRDTGQADCDVLFHDAARPLIDQRLIADCVRALGDYQAVGVAVPTADTIAMVDEGLMTAIPPRESLVRCQTPQGFRLSLIRRAYELAAADLRAGRFAATDDCGVVLRYLPEVKIAIVQGSDRNIKVTYPADITFAESLLRAGPSTVS